MSVQKSSQKWNGQAVAKKLPQIMAEVERITDEPNQEEWVLLRNMLHELEVGLDSPGVLHPKTRVAS